MINFGVGRSICVPKQIYDGSAIATPTPVVLASLQEIGVDMSVELKKLKAARRYPLAIAQAGGNIAVKAKYATFDAAIYGSLFAGKASTAGIKGVDQDVVITVSGTSPYTVTAAPSNSGTFVADLGLINPSTGKLLNRVTSSPAAGEYSVTSGGVYTFNVADLGKTFIGGWEYSASSASGKVFNITNDVMGPTPSFSMYLKQSFDGETLVMKLNKCVSGKMNLPAKSEDFTVYDFEAEAFDDGTGNIGWMCLYSGT